MPLHPRIRKTVILTTFILTGFVFGLWMIGGFCDRVLATISNGHLHLYASSNSILTSPSVTYFHDLMQVRFPGAVAQGASTTVWRCEFSPWVVVIALLLIAIIAARLHAVACRRAMIGLCPKCAYSRTGLAPSAVCPECGSPAPPSSPAHR